jgi:hypothetical protein
MIETVDKHANTNFSHLIFGVSNGEQLILHGDQNPFRSKIKLRPETNTFQKRSVGVEHGLRVVSVKRVRSSHGRKAINVLT